MSGSKHVATAPLSSFQGRVAPFMEHCFGPEISADTMERYHRFIEESLELAQAIGCTAADAHMLVEYVFNRPVGQSHQEAGGVMVTLAALCLAAGLDMHAAGEDELRRVWGKIDVIREKQKNKPKGSPLPQYAGRSESATPTEELDPGVKKLLQGYVDDRHVPDESVREAVNGYPNGVEYLPFQNTITSLWMERDRLVKALSATRSAIGTRTDWIPVSERLPKAEYGDTSHSGVKAIISADVLAYFEDGVVRVGNYDHEAQFWHMVSINEPIRSDIDPTHWMPMPGGPHG